MKGPLPPAGADTPSAPVTVAVVSWNTRELLLRCLDSLAPEVEAGRAMVWVVDNLSSDDSGEAARRHAPWARVELAPVNLGFGPAVNRVARETSSPWLLCLNADVELRPGALGTMLAAAADPGVGCVAPRLESQDGHPQHSIHSLPTLGFVLALNLGLHVLSRGVADRMLLDGRYDPNRPRHVPWAYGACLLLRRSAFQEVGGFNEAQWMYAEDLELGWRLRETGWKVLYEPGARVLHVGGAATGQAFGDGAARTQRYMEATYRAVARRRGRSYALLVGAVNVGGAAARVAWMSPLALLSGRWRRARAGNVAWVRAHWRGLRAARSSG